MSVFLLLIIGLEIFIIIKVNSVYKITLLKKHKEYTEIAVSEAMNEAFDEEVEEDLPDAEEFIIKTGKASTSSLQSAFYWRYNKAARIIERLEEEGVIGPVRQGERFREVLKQED